MLGGLPSLRWVECRVLSLLAAVVVALMRSSLLLSSSALTLLPWQSAAFGARPGAIVVMSRRVVLQGGDALDVGVFLTCFS